MSFIFICWSWMLWPCWTHFLVLVGGFFGGFFGILYIDCCVICWQKQFHIFISNLHVFIFILFQPVAEARFPSTILKKNGESEHLSLVPDLRRKAFSPSPLCVILAVGFLWMILIKVRWCLNLLKVFFIINGVGYC